MIERTRRHLRPIAPLVQGAAALGGLLALAYALTQLPYAGGPVSPWIRRFFVGWCVLVPYWHYLEYTLLMDRDDGHALRLQRLSRMVWLGGMAALGAFVARG